jgi:hypothetical protein
MSKRGRPKQEQRLKDVRISACLEPEELAGLKAYAKQARSSLSYAVRMTVRRGLGIDDTAAAA